MRVIEWISVCDGSNASEWINTRNQNTSLINAHAYRQITYTHTPYTQTQTKKKRKKRATKNSKPFRQWNRLSRALKMRVRFYGRCFTVCMIIFNVTYLIWLSLFFFAPREERHKQMAVSKSKQTGAVKNIAITAAKIKIKTENNTCVGRIWFYRIFILSPSSRPNKITHRGCYIFHRRTCMCLEFYVSMRNFKSV